ncbi:unnamed protein product [Caenorhabditis bovis]|uniref:Nuclear nucleic acid-binding protein C1D n=1 Tax=Caenorhabditis bovis TaxID=2654633 RepID=A0A8S1ERT0_9PELO|nr:unnamed protein product [Caenorhabditis bovis]
MAENLPEEVKQKLQNFDNTLTALEKAVDSVIKGGVDKHYERNAHEMALVDTMAMFIMDSLLWTTHGLRGELPEKNEELLIDLNRTKRLAGEMKEVNLRQEAPRVNSQAATNFVRNALWEPKEKE